jgi:hypothetical protein
VKRRFLRIFAAAGTILLGGCNSQGSVWSQYFEFLRQGYHSSVGSGLVSMEQAAEIPYATLAYRVDGSSERMLVLATDTSGVLLWTAASHIVLLTKDGRILRSVGLRNDRSDLRSQTGGAITPLTEALKGPYRSTRQADFADLGLYGVVLNCITQQRGRQLINILGTALATTRIDERCESRSPRWSFTDSFWLDTESGLAWQSLQHLHPKGTVLQIKILRPPS